MATDISCANRGISGSEAVQGRSLPGSAEERNRRVSTLLLVAHTLHAREIAHKVAGQGAAGFEPATRRLEDVSTESVPVHPCRPRGLDQGFHRTRNRQVWGKLHTELHTIIGLYMGQAMASTGMFGAALRPTKGTGPAQPCGSAQPERRADRRTRAGPFGPG